MKTMNYKRTSIKELASRGYLRYNGSQYFIGGKMIVIISTNDGEWYKYEHGREWYRTLRKAIDAFGEN